MKNVTVRLSEEKVESLDEEADDLGLSRADYIRDLLKKGRVSKEIQAECEQLQAELEETHRRLSDQKEEHGAEVEALKDEHKAEVAEIQEQYESRIDDLQRQLAATNKRVDEHQELVEYVEKERELQRHREQRRREREEANVLTRAWWWVTGRPSEANATGD